MPLSSVKQTVPFTFGDLYTNIETQFNTAGYDISPGSNVSQLITAMTYLTSMLNVNTAVNINENILSLATVRENALVDARELGYEIQHKLSYTYTLTVEFSGGVATSGIHRYTVDKYTEFAEGGHTYIYRGDQLVVTTPVDSVNNPTGLVTASFVVEEGTVLRALDAAGAVLTPELSVTTGLLQDATGAWVAQQYVDLPFLDIEDSGIECFATYYDDYGVLVQDEQWLKSSMFMLDKDLLTVNRFARVDNIKTKTPRLYFKPGGGGRGLKTGTQLTFNLLKTSSTLGAMANPSNPQGVSHTVPFCAVTNIQLTTQGAQEETIDSIKLNAPKFYNSANRAVTPSDYQAFCTRQSSVKSAVVWGGDLEMPKSPGHVWFSFLPSNSTRTFNNTPTNSEFMLNNNSYTAWDYTLPYSAGALGGSNYVNLTTTPVATVTIPVTASTTGNAYVQQQNAANAYFANWYLQDAEIKTPPNSTANAPGIWDSLAPYTIPTLQFHNRHPLYMDMEYDLSIMKYNIVTSKANVHQNVFNVIDSFYTGIGDSINTETFNNTYYHSSLTKRIDTLLTDNSGINSALKSSIVITEKNVQSENALDGYKDVFVPLSVPREQYFDSNGQLISAVMPNIDTAEFIDYRDVNSLTTISAVNKKPLSNLYTDWAEIFPATATNPTPTTPNTIPHSAMDVIVATIRSHQVETTTPLTLVVAPPALAAYVVPLTNIEVWPDDPSVLDFDTLSAKYSKTKVIHISAPVIVTPAVPAVLASPAVPAVQAVPAVPAVIAQPNAIPPIVGVPAVPAVLAVVGRLAVAAQPAQPAVTTPGVETVLVFADYRNTTPSIQATKAQVEQQALQAALAAGSTPTVAAAASVQAGAAFVATVAQASPNSWSVDPSASAGVVFLETPLLLGERIRVETETACGKYYLYNKYDKRIMIQLYVDGNFSKSGTPRFNSASAYLKTAGCLYGFTTDSLYLTSAGYAMNCPGHVSNLTGSIIKTISPSSYHGSALKMDLFKRDRRLSLTYASPNFDVSLNVIPRLRRVTFA